MRTFLLIFFVFATLGLYACSHGGVSSEQSPELANTSWTRINTDHAGLSFRARMDFYGDHFDFILMERAEGHSNSTARMDLSPGEIMITHDADCPGADARYTWSIEGDVLLLKKISDTCEARFQAMEGRWNRLPQ